MLIKLLLSIVLINAIKFILNEEYGFDVKKGQTKGWYHDLKAERAYTTGGLDNLLKGIRFWFKKGQKGIGTYRRSQQTEMGEFLALNIKV